jgi:hypothetical protein
MAYRNKTYVIFDGDSDMWAYAFMKGWKQNEKVEFDFFDAHDLRPLTDRASEESVKRSLRERMANAKQVIVLVGENTKDLYRFVRWEIELAMNKDLPIIVANLNDSRALDSERCPPILRDHCAVHVAFKMRIIKFALDGFVDWYNSANRDSSAGWRYYTDDVYRQLGL